MWFRLAFSSFTDTEKDFAAWAAGTHILDMETAQFSVASMPVDMISDSYSQCSSEDSKTAKQTQVS